MSDPLQARSDRGSPASVLGPRQRGDAWDRLAAEQEISEAALQYVRKVSGYHKPSRLNQAAFDAAAPIPP